MTEISSRKNPSFDKFIKITFSFFVLLQVCLLLHAWQFLHKKSCSSFFCLIQGCYAIFLFRMVIGFWFYYFFMLHIMPILSQILQKKSIFLLDFGLSLLTSLQFILDGAGFYKPTIPQSPPSHLQDYSTCNNARLEFSTILFQALVQMNSAWKIVSIAGGLNPGPLLLP